MVNHKCLVIMEQNVARVFHKDSDEKEFQVVHYCGEETIPIDDDMEIFCEWFSNNIIEQLDDSVDLCVLYDACNSNHAIEEKLIGKKIHLVNEDGYWSKQKIGEILSKRFISMRIIIKSETGETLAEISTDSLEFVKYEEKIFYTGYSFEKTETVDSIDNTNENAFAKYYIREAEKLREIQ